MLRTSGRRNRGGSDDSKGNKEIMSDRKRDVQREKGERD